MNENLELMVTGDLHLGVHPSSVPEDVDSDQFSPGWVWRRIVEEAVSRSVDAVVLTGDVVDRRNQVFEAWGPFEAGVTELTAAGIPLVVVAGNHDAEVLPDFMESMDKESCHLIGRGGQWERWTLEIQGQARMHLDGWSYPQEHVRRNPLEDYELPEADEPVIGLLHTELNANDSPYAPSTTADLKETVPKGWLLGHVHRSGLRNQTPPILYPGTPQPLDPSETGVHGPWIVTVTPTGEIQCAQQPLSTLQYETVELDVSEVRTLEELPRRVQTVLKERLADRNRVNTLDLILVRLLLSGRTELFRSIEKERASLRESLALVTDGTPVRIEKIENRTRPAFDLDELRQENSPVGVLAEILTNLETENYEDLPEDLLEDIDQSVRNVHEANTYEPLRRHTSEGRPEGEDQLDLLTQQARNLLDQLLTQKDGES